MSGECVDSCTHRRVRARDLLAPHPGLHTCHAVISPVSIKLDHFPKRGCMWQLDINWPQLATGATVLVWARRKSGEIVDKWCICTERRDWQTKVSRHDAHINKLNYRYFVSRQCILIFTFNMIFKTRPHLSGFLILGPVCATGFLHSVFVQFDSDWLSEWLQSLLKLQLSPRLTVSLCSRSKKGHFNIWKLVWLCAADLPLHDLFVIRDSYDPVVDACSFNILFFSAASSHKLREDM